MVSEPSLDEHAQDVPPKRTKWKLFIAIASLAVVVIIIVAVMTFPPWKGIIAQTYLHNGDYIEYSMSGMAVIIPLSGSLRIDISNVTNDGFRATVTSSGIPGIDSETIDCSWDDSLSSFLDLGSKVGTNTTSTPWGEKSVDVYFLQNTTGDITTYLGNDPEVIYRVDLTSSVYTMTIEMIDTNIDLVKNGNK